VDTITNAEADTILVGPSSSTYYTFNSNFAYIYVLNRTTIDGTPNTTMVLQESNVSTGGASDWYVVATASGTGATTTSVSAANLFGRRHRLILTGTGTQRTSYKVTATLKKVN